MQSIQKRAEMAVKNISQIIEQGIYRSRTFRDLPLSRKLFIFSAIFIIIPMVFVGVISYEQSAAVLEEQARIHNTQAIEQVETHIEYYVRDFEISTLKILNHPDFTRFLHMKTPEEVQQSGIRHEIQDLLQAEAYSRPDITAITVILDNIQVIDSIGVGNPYPASKLREEYWYDSVPFNGIPFLVSRTIQWPNHKQQVISIIRRIHSPYTLQPIGMLVIDVNFRRLQEVSEKFNLGDRYFFIVDSNGHYVYHPDTEKIGRPADMSGLDTILKEKAGAMVVDSREFLTYSQSPSLGWTFVTSIPYQELRKEAGHIGETITWTVILALFAAYILGIAFAASVMRPIRRLQNFMNKVEVGDFSERVKVDCGDELGQLSQGFNKMVTRLAALMEEVYFSKLRETEASLRQKEMEVKVLQSQINPHFLCNSLETIRGMALERNNENIANMAASLGVLLRYNLRSTLPTVALREEINFCKVYLQIQQYRFENQFEYEFLIPDWALDLTIVKFALQPLVENCLVHSIHATGKPTAIQIAVERENEEAFVILISDTGAGIPKETLAKIRLDLAEKDVTAGGNNLGMVNVHRRIVNLFGSEYGIRVESEFGKGTQVLVRLPIILYHADGGKNDAQRFTG